MQSWIKIIIITICLFFPARFVSAETQESRENVITREVGRLEIAEEAAEKAEEKKELEAFKVEFKDVLLDPDNIDLNFQYAEQQIAAGNFLGAAGTLERILMVNPNLPKVRLFYAVVLFRLDNLIEAEREIQLLTDVEMPDELRQELKQYQKAIRQRQKNTRITFRQTVGVGYDSNRNAAPSSRRRLFFEIPIQLNETNRRRADSNFINVTGVELVHQLPGQAGHELFANATYFLQEQTNQDPLDLGSLQFELGTTLKNKFFNFMSKFASSQVYLSKEHYLRTFSGEFRASRQIKKFNVHAGYKIEKQDFLPIEEVQIVRERDGYENTVYGGFDFTMTDSMRLSWAIQYQNKNARQDYEGYERILLRQSHTWLLGKGQFLINALDVNFDHYDEVDASVASRRRREKGLRYRVTYGTPVSLFLPDKLIPHFVETITASLSYEYFRSLANITNFTYFNHKMQFLLSKRIDL